MAIEKIKPLKNKPQEKKKLSWKIKKPRANKAKTKLKKPPINISEAGDESASSPTVKRLSKILEIANKMGGIKTIRYSMPVSLFKSFGFYIKACYYFNITAKN